MAARDCFYCWFVGRVAPWGMLALAGLLWLLNIDKNLNYTAIWLVILAVCLLVGSWLMGRLRS